MSPPDSKPCFEESRRFRKTKGITTPQQKDNPHENHPKKEGIFSEFPGPQTLRTSREKDFGGHMLRAYSFTTKPSETPSHAFISHTTCTQ